RSSVHGKRARQSAVRSKRRKEWRRATWSYTKPKQPTKATEQSAQNSAASAAEARCGSGAHLIHTENPCRYHAEDQVLEHFFEALPDISARYVIKEAFQVVCQLIAHLRKSFLPNQSDFLSTLRLETLVLRNYCFDFAHALLRVGLDLRI